MKTTVVYTLTDPRDNKVKYIGITSQCLSSRLSHHCTVLKSRNKKVNWIKKLKALNLKPSIEILDIFDSFTEALYFEQYWIAQFKAWGFNLVNSTLGGEGALGYKHTLVTLLKLKRFYANKPKKEKRKIMTKTEQYNYLSKVLKKSILQYDQNGHFIKKWDSCTDAAKVYNVKSSAIGHALKDNSRVCKGFFWRKYIDDYPLELNIKPLVGNKVSIQVYDKLNDEYINFISKKEAFLYTGRMSHPNKYINQNLYFKNRFKFTTL